MATDDAAAVDEIREVLDLPEPDRTRRLETLLADADAAGHVNAGIVGRLDQVMVKWRTGTEWLADFAWCEAAWARQPTALMPFVADALLLYYAFVVHTARDRSAIPTARVLQLIDAMDLRYEQAGRSRYLPLLEGHLVSLIRGDAREAERRFLLSETAPDDPNVPRMHAVAIDWFALGGHDEDAVARYAATVRGVDDPSVAQGLHGAVLWPLLRLGRRADAADCLQRGIAAAERERSDLEWRAPMISAAGALGDLDRGLELVRAWVEDNDDEDGTPLARSDVVVTKHCVLLFDALIDAGRGGERVAHLGDRTIEDLAATWRADAAELTAQADAVNATDAETRALERFWARHAFGERRPPPGAGADEVRWEQDRS